MSYCGMSPIARRSSVVRPTNRFEDAFELVGMTRPRQRVRVRNEPGFHQPRQRFFERERPLLARQRHLLMQMLQRVLANVLPRAVADHQQLDRRRRGRRRSSAISVCVITAETRERQLLANGVLPLVGERVADARDGRRDVGRVQAAEHEMPGLGRRQRNAHRFVIAHLADDEDVGRLPHGAAQRGGEVGRIGADLDLLDRCSDRAGARTRSGSSTVMMCRASRRLISSTSAAIVVVLPAPVAPPISTRPRPSDDSGVDFGRQRQLRQAWHSRRQHPDGGRGAAALAMQVHAEAAEPREAERGVGNPGLLKLSRACGGSSGTTASSTSVPSRIGPSRRTMTPVDADAGRAAGDQQQIAAAPRDDLRQQRLRPARGLRRCERCRRRR